MSSCGGKPVGGDQSRARRAGFPADRGPHDVVPVIDWHRCKLKGDCLEACPRHLLRMRKMNPEELASLPLIARLGLALYGAKIISVTDPQRCTGCGLCLNACPLGAIQLVPADGVASQSKTGRRNSPAD